MGFARLILEENKRFILGIIILPALLIGLIGLIFGKGVREVPLAIVSRDTGIELPFVGKVSFSQQVIERIDKNIIKLIEVKDENEAFQMLKRGEVFGVLIFPENFTKEMLIKMEDPKYQLSEKIVLKSDKSSIVVFGVVMSTILNSFMDLVKQNSGNSILPIDVQAAFGVENVVFGDYILSGIITLLVFIISVVGISLIMLKDKRKFLFSNYSSVEVIFSYLLVFSIVILVSVVLMYSVSIPLFNMNLNSGAWVALLGTFLYLLVSVSLGVFIGLSLKNYEGLRVALVASILPLFFGNVILPMEAMPSWLRPIVYIFPPYYGVKIYRGAMLKQLGLYDLSPEFIILGIFFAGFLLLSFLSFNKVLRGE